MSSTATDGGGVRACTAFPEALFTIEGDPHLIEADSQAAGKVAGAAVDAEHALRSKRLDSWVGSEGEMYRWQLDRYPAMVVSAHRVYARLASLLQTFADVMGAKQAQMRRLRVEAEHVWASLQAAQAAAAIAAGDVTSAHEAATTLPRGGDPRVVMDAAAARVERAEASLAAARSRVSRVQAQWQDCLDRAEKLQRDMGHAAGTATQGILATAQPPQAPTRLGGLPGELAYVVKDDHAEEALDGLQTALDLMGLIPGLGEIADGTNVVIYLARGDKTNAALSAAAMIPFLGWGATGAKGVRAGAHALKNAAHTTTGQVARGSQRAAKLLYPSAPIKTLRKATHGAINTLPAEGQRLAYTLLGRGALLEKKVNTHLPGLPQNTPPITGKASTGRTIPRNLAEQLALTAARSHPRAGKVLRIRMTDPRWPDEKGWMKMQFTTHGVTIHYVLNKITGAVDDFKIK